MLLPDALLRLWESVQLWPFPPPLRRLASVSMMLTCMKSMRLLPARPSTQSIHLRFPRKSLTPEVAQSHLDTLLVVLVLARSPLSSVSSREPTRSTVLSLCALEPAWEPPESLKEKLEFKLFSLPSSNDLLSNDKHHIKLANRIIYVFFTVTSLY